MALSVTCTDTDYYNGFGQSSIPNISIGTAETNRRVVIWFQTDVEPSTATIGGVSATIHGKVEYTNYAAGYWAAICSAVVPTGTTATLSVSGVGEIYAGQAWAITGGASDFSDSFSHIYTTGDSAGDFTFPMEDHLNMGQNTIVITNTGIYSTTNAGTTYSFSPSMVEDFDGNYSGDEWYSGRHYADSYEEVTSVAFTVDVDNDVTQLLHYIGVSFNPPGTNASASVTGTSATGSVGTVATNYGYSNTTTGESATASVGDVSVATPTTAHPSGNSVTGSVGSVTVTAGSDITVNLTGTSAISSVGLESIQADFSVSTTGEAATGSIGDVDVQSDFSLAVTGSSASGSVGTASVSLPKGASVTGEDATASVGDVSLTFDFSVSVTGESATGSVGEVVAGVVASIHVTGEDATGSVGNETVQTGWSVSVTGESATGSVGDIEVQTPVDVTGVSATGSVGDVSTDVTSIDISATGQSATGSVDDVSVKTESSLSVTGEEAAGEVGSVVISTPISISLTGNSVTGSVGSESVTGEANVPIVMDGLLALLQPVDIDYDYSVDADGLSGTGNVGNVRIGYWHKVPASTVEIWQRVV